MKYYTGIGSRETPQHVLEIMRESAKALASLGWVLRSGGAEGADTAFEEGASEANQPTLPEIYLPWPYFNDRGWGTHYRSEYVRPLDLGEFWFKARDIAATTHPAWGNCKAGAKALHTRNVFQVLGKDLNSPSKFLICYAEPKGDSISGGTATAYNLAKSRGIECFNLYFGENITRLQGFLDRSKK